MSNGYFPGATPSCTYCSKGTVYSSILENCVNSGCKMLGAAEAELEELLDDFGRASRSLLARKICTLAAGCR